jgi:hypothetical protein
MCWVILLRHISSWHGAELSTSYVSMAWYIVKPRKNFTFTLSDLKNYGVGFLVFISGIHSRIRRTAWKYVSGK